LEQIVLDMQGQLPKEIQQIRQAKEI